MAVAGRASKGLIPVRGALERGSHASGTVFAIDPQTGKAGSAVKPRMVRHTQQRPVQNIFF
jgi:hypothetical protein